MKKIKPLFLFIIVIFFTQKIQAQVVTIPDVNFLNALIEKGVDKNNDQMIQVSEALLVDSLNIGYREIESLEGINSFINLKSLYCFDNFITVLDLSGLINLKELLCQNNFIESMDISDLVNLENLDMSNCGVGILDVSNLTKLTRLFCNDNLFINIINLKNLSNLEYLILSNCKLTSFNSIGLNKLIYLDLSDNLLTSLNLDNLSSIDELSLSYNNLDSLDFSGFDNIGTLNIWGGNSLRYLNMGNGFIGNLIVSGLNISTLDLSKNTFYTLEISSNENLNFIDINNFGEFTIFSSISIYSNNNLKGIYLKNTSNIVEEDFSLFNNRNLKFVCVDSDELENVLSFGDSIPYTSFCSSSPDQYFSLKNTSRFDANSNGCTVQDSIFAPLKIKISDGVNEGFLISNNQGNFVSVVDSGIYTLTPVFENNYFKSSPTSISVSLPDTLLPSFCITANGTHNDVSVTLIPTIPARPGFSDATFKLVYSNKGNSNQSGVITFDYPDAKTDFISSIPVANTSVSGRLSYNYTNLAPFETRTITITMRTNSPSNTPAVNVGDVLDFSANITGTGTDDNTADNTFLLKQTVIGSFDPNDKACLQGNVITPATVGKYVDYLIRFENTGTANAENVEITDYIDLNKFDISTLQVTSTSHSCRTTISEGNKVQFFFSKINLPFTEPNKHGYVAFKIKTKPTLVIGDSLQNKAYIFFDYNLPEITNFATSYIRTLTPINNKFSTTAQLSILPNPNKGVFNAQFESLGTYDLKVQLLDITGREVYQNILFHNNSSMLQFELPNIAKGMYQLLFSNSTDIWSQKVLVN